MLKAIWNKVFVNLTFDISIGDVRRLTKTLFLVILTLLLTSSKKISDVMDRSKFRGVSQMKNKLSLEKRLKLLPNSKKKIAF